MSTLFIPQYESGVIRIFSISRPMSDMARALKQRPKAMIASDLLGHDIKDEAVELFALADLTGVGLPRYLNDGYDVDDDVIQADRARLEALDGYVLLLFSKVSETGDVTLNPSADLTLIGTYSEPKAAHSAVPIAAEAAKPYSGVAASTQPTKRGPRGSIFTALAAIIIAILIYWILR
ncbi:hypothetical protein [uncultured Sulfitobacter sp.]|uniref:hypothetical protein n=1 Tax=uncultured Sulfitobacter sp. TaxID=191468 RepID=UPI002607AEA1|nr:hypothetical protein [uncultured Sulfitobacter sp.]